jgi:nicotinate-nucleotide adenylyltransferase
MRLGVFGGSFDPVHLGHLRLADCCWRQASLDQVLFVPAARQPHKPRAPRASDGDRVAMLELAVGGRAEFGVSTIEIRRGGVSYTVDTLRAIRAERPAEELFFLMGADTLADLPNWREPAAICELAKPLVVRRPGSGEPDYAAIAPLVSAERLATIRSQAVEMAETEISSSEIRRLIGEGGAWEELVPASVADYINARGLYGAEAE